MIRTTGKKDKRIRRFAVLEIILLLVSIIAFSYMLGQSVPSVSAQEEQCARVKESSKDMWKIISVPQSISNLAELKDWCGENGWLTSCYFAPCPRFGGESQTTQIPTAVLPIGGGLASNYYLGKLTGGAGTEAATTASSTETTGEDLVGGTGAGTAAGVSLLKKPILGTEISVGSILTDAAIATGIYIGSRWILNKIPGVSNAFAEAGGRSLAGGYLIHEIGVPILSKLSSLIGIGSISGPLGWILTGIATIIIFVLTYKETKFEQVTFTCGPWVAPFGGENCQKCNSEDFTCTEYQCKSLGQDCELINQGTKDALCIWNNPRDNKPPIINSWEKVLTVGYKYSPESVSSPPDRGVRIVNENSDDECVQPWERLTIGITLDEPAICKMSEINSPSYDEMESIYWSGGISKQNHSYTFSLPGPEFLESNNITLKNNGEFSLYTRCTDRNKQASIGNFVFRYCVGDADLTEPQIYSTSIFNNSYIGFGETEVPLSVYVNEPAECRWSRINQDYEAMENEMFCSSQSEQFNDQIVFPCTTTLTGLNDYPAQNDYYFRCKDQPELKGTDEESDRRTNQRSYLYRLLGSRSLVISEVRPNGTIRDSTEPIAVTLEAETFSGAHEGEALCYFSTTGETGSFTQFKTTGTNTHSQRLDLGEGDYTYTIRCEDAGGNVDEKTTSFTVEADTEPPIIVRAFHGNNQLQIITNEEASCVYSTTISLGCTYLFEDGTSMTSLDNNKHQTSWNPDKTFYIKCEDEFSNMLIDNQCNIIIRPFETG